VQRITLYLEDTGNTARKVIYFEGWRGLGASAVLRAMAEEPPPSVRERFDKILHIDCSRWKSRRVLQRTIAEQLKLPPEVMSAFDRQDEEDDFSGVDEGSRGEIAYVTGETFQAIRNLTCLVIFHNGSDGMVDLTDFGFPQFNWFNPNVLLWTFRGRLQLIEGIRRTGYSSDLVMYLGGVSLQGALVKEARYIIQRQHALYTQSITPETAAECFLYQLWLIEKGRGIMDYNWAIQASNYWVCDGIILGGLSDKAWEVSSALCQQLKIDDLTYYEAAKLPRWYESDSQQWQSVPYTTSESGEQTEVNICDTTLNPESTSFFFGCQAGLSAQLPDNMFQKSDRLRVLKLCGCKFSFFSPPFRCCRGLRFLGLDNCKDERQQQQEDRMEFFHNLWVLDISHTDWDPDVVGQMAANIRDVHIKQGRVWCKNLAWRQLRNLRKLRVINPTSSWETGNKDEFNDMVKLELLDLTGNVTVQVLPSLSGATGLKTLVLDGCVGLEHVGPEGLPPSLEAFSLDVESSPKDQARVSKISLEGCVHLKSFLLRGGLSILEELNLSGTSIRKLDLSMVEVPRLNKVFLVGCKLLRAIRWGSWGYYYRKLEVLCIDTHGRNEDTRAHSSVSYSSYSTKPKNYVAAGDARFIQSCLCAVTVRSSSYNPSADKITRSLYLHLHVPPSSSRSSSCRSSSRVADKPCSYSDLTLDDDDDDEIPWPEASDWHVEVGEGISFTDVQSEDGILAVAKLVYDLTGSLHVHDNSCMLDIMPRIPRNWFWVVSCLQWCRVERCAKLQAVFSFGNSGYRQRFNNLWNFWASDLLGAYCIWSKSTIKNDSDNFKALQRIYVHSCPRIKFVLPFSSEITLPSLETLHITLCGDLREVFPWDSKMPERYETEGAVKKFSKLKHIHLHDLPSLQEICAAKMYAPMLESINLRGCWSLSRLPAVGHGRPIVHCEKDCWEKLKWEGLDASHHPSLYRPRHSSYRKERRLRGTVLR
jgi:hypothetical protein